MYLLKGRESYDHPNRASQKHGHALSDAPFRIRDASKYYPWYEINPIEQQYMSIKIDKNYPDWFVHKDDCSSAEVPPVVPPTVPPSGTISDVEVSLAILTILNWFKQK